MMMVKSDEKTSRSSHKEASQGGLCKRGLKVPTHRLAPLCPLSHGPNPGAHPLEDRALKPGPVPALETQQQADGTWSLL